MKNSKKALALLLTLMLAASMVSCGGNGDSGSSGTSDSTTSTGDASTGSDTSGEAAPTEVSLPLADGESLSYFIALDANASIVVDDYNDNEFFQALEERPVSILTG